MQGKPCKPNREKMKRNIRKKMLFAFGGVCVVLVIQLLVNGFFRAE